MALFTDIDAVLDDLQTLYWNTGYDGSDATSSSLDLDGLELPRSAALLISTQNGSSSDVVDVDIQDSADDSSWSDFDASISTLNDSSGELIHVLDLEDARRYIRVDLDSGDQTVGSTIDLLVAIASCGSQQSQSV